MRGDRRLQTDSAVPAVSPLNLNLPAPHGMRQPSMGLRFASEARDAGFPPKGALLRQSFRVSVWLRHIWRVWMHRLHHPAACCLHYCLVNFDCLASVWASCVLFTTKEEEDGGDNEENNSGWNMAELSSTLCRFQPVASRHQIKVEEKSLTWRI